MSGSEIRKCYRETEMELGLKRENECLVDYDFNLTFQEIQLL